MPEHLPFDRPGWRTFRWAVARGAGLPTSVEPAESPPWRGVLFLARRHDLDGVVADGLAGLDGVPDAVSEAFERRRTDLALRHLRHLEVLATVTSEFASIGVDSVVLKGLPLARQAYPSHERRTLGDLDLLVRPDDRAAAERVLLGLGRRRQDHPDVPAAGFPRADDPVHAGFAYVGAASPAVDLQWRLGAVGSSSVVSVEEAMERRIRPWPDLADVHTLDLVDHLAYVTSHAAKHRFARLKWVLDVGLLERACAGGDRRQPTRAGSTAAWLFERLLTGERDDGPPDLLTEVAGRALASPDRDGATSLVDRERYLVSLGDDGRERAGLMWWRLRRGLHALRRDR